MDIDSDTKEFLEFVQDWHKMQTNQLRLITEKKAKSIKFGNQEIDGDSDVAKGIRIGVSLALDLLGELPFNVTET